MRRGSVRALGFVLSGIAVTTFGQTIYGNGDSPRRIYANRTAGPNVLGLTASQLEQISQMRKNIASVVLDDSQKAQLAALQSSVPEAGEAAELGLLAPEWKISCVCNNFQSVARALGLTSAQLTQLKDLRTTSPADRNKALSVLTSPQHAKLNAILLNVIGLRNAVQLGLVDLPERWAGGECLCN